MTIKDTPMDSTRVASFLTKKEIVNLLGVTPKTVERWMKHEGLPYFKIGGLVRIGKADFQGWLYNRKKERHLAK